MHCRSDLSRSCVETQWHGNGFEAGPAATTGHERRPTTAFHDRDDDPRSLEGRRGCWDKRDVCSRVEQVPRPIPGRYVSQGVTDLLSGRWIFVEAV